MAQTGVVSWSQTAASNGTADSSVNWAEGMAPSAVNDSARAEMASVAKYRDDTAGTLTTGGTSTAYTLTTNQVFSALTVLNGQELTVKFNATNGASPTLNVDTLGAKPIQIDASTAVPTGGLTINSIWRLTYNNAGGYFVVNGYPQTLGALTTTGNVSVGGTLGSTGAFTASSTSHLVGAVTMDAAATVGTTLGVTGAFTASSTSHLVGAVTMDGAATVGTTLGVTGALTASSTSNMVGDFSVNTNKFNVTAASGNTTAAGTLTSTGAFTASSTSHLVGAVTADAAVSVGTTLGVTGAATFSSSALSSSASGGIGYTTGAGGTVTQLTDKTTAVTLNKMVGQITLAASNLAAGAIVSFQLNCTGVTANDLLILNHVSGGTRGFYSLMGACSGNVATVTLTNIGGTGEAAAIVLSYAFIRGATS